ncbi:NAD-dependent epimerase/dehydratase family protein [Nakamurella sp. YIM 132087]|uniref:NAD-dependent epimerase/dehydratase family protein n=1 Tax=Nakamurella alba TaxID=2665158 RepID=A0A7K1FE74_9ACTN|nr:NAD-dependent epimerase/dehydratase family protein [Nakamurella alba]
METSVLVVGASGLVGTAVVREYLTTGAAVTAVSRRPPGVPLQDRLRHLPLDLLDATATADALRATGPFDAVVYAAAFEKPGLVPGWSDPDQMQTNLDMLRNTLEGLVDRPPRHITTMQGTKAYGVHLHRIPLPARERAPRDPHPNFYWLQEDLLREYCARHGSEWTIFRPVQVVGPAFGVAYCTPPVIGAFAALARESGEDFSFPGGRFAPVHTVDVGLVARAVVWARAEQRAFGEHFNLTNGEVFSWPEIWPSFAEVFGITAAEPKRQRLTDFFARHADTWDRVVHRHGLRPLPLDAVLGTSHQYADYTFGADLVGHADPALVSTVKVKQAGFTEVRDTEAVFREALTGLMELRVLPH